MGSLTREKLAGGATIAAVAILAAVTYGSVVAKLVHDWAYDGNYSHGFLIVPVAAYLVWRKREHLRGVERKPSALGLLIVIGSLGLYVGGILGAELFTTRMSMIGFLAGTLVFLYGWRLARALAFPLGLLLLAIPLPAIIFNQITFPLQLLASWFGATSLQALHIPVLREGNVMTLATTTLYVAEACSGIRSLMSLVTIAILYGYFTDPRGGVRVVLTLAAVPTAVVANGARIAVTGIAASYIGAEAAEGALHMFSGWVLFIVAMVLLMLIKRAIVLVAGPPATGANARPWGAEGLSEGNRSVA